MCRPTEIYISLPDGVSTKAVGRDYKHRPPGGGHASRLSFASSYSIEAERDLHLISYSKVCRTDYHFVLHNSLASLEVASGANPSLPE